MVPVKLEKNPDDPIISSTTNPKNAWFPVATEADVPYGHLYICQLLDEELLLWRDREDQIHVWKDLCPHRSVRLSIGRHLGDTVQCANHGWQFNAQGQCSFVPAHPKEPASHVCVKRYRRHVADGLVWATLSDSETRGKHLFPETVMSSRRALRPMPVNAGFDKLMAALTQLQPGKGYSLLEQREEVILFGVENSQEMLAFTCRPATADRTVIYGVLTAQDDDQDMTSRLRYFNDQLKALRDNMESDSN